ncbi:hypothetical protein Bbelb_042510 [Branchiostoma belcheri]|nr:hypothetical protein Bbelb_042510 [Branchiostoma belcheri]
MPSVSDNGDSYWVIDSSDWVCFTAVPSQAGKVHLQLKITERAVACAALRTAFQNMDPEKEVFLSSEQTTGIFVSLQPQTGAPSKKLLVGKKDGTLLWSVRVAGKFIIRWKRNRRPPGGK